MTTAVNPPVAQPNVVVLSTCTVVATLEIFDSDTGKTQVVLSSGAAAPGTIVPVLTFTPGGPPETQ